MVRRKEDIKTFNFKKIIQYFQNFDFQSKMLFYADEAFLQGNTNFLKLKMMKI